MNLGALASSVIDLSKKSLKPVSVKNINKAPSEKRERNYCVLPARACRDQRINKTAAFVVLATICQYTNRNGETYVGQIRLAEDLGVSHQAISKQIKILIDLGYLERLQKGNKNFSARHRVIFDPSMTLEDVKAATPARLPENNTEPPPLSKDEAAARIKQLKDRMKSKNSTQPQRLNDDGISTQPLGLSNNDSQRNLEGGSIQPRGGFNSTSGGCKISKESNIKEGAFERWMEK